MELRPGERIIDEGRFVAANQARSQHLTGRARETYREKLEHYCELKRKHADGFTGTENFV